MTNEEQKIVFKTDGEDKTPGISIWNAAIEEAAKTVDHILSEGGKTQGDLIRSLKK